MNSKAGNKGIEQDGPECLGLKVGDPVPKPPKPLSEEQIMSTWEGSPETPLLSVLCITYNHAPYIEDALNSFLMQETNFPFEIIVHDDASTDGNQAIIKKYEEKYPRLIRAVYQKENQYSKGRRALGFFQGMSSARYLAVCEGDDYWLDPKKLQKQVDFLERNEDYVITGHDAFVIDEAGTLIKPSKLPESHKRDYSGDELSRDKAWILTMSWVHRNLIEDFAPERNMVRNGDNFLVSLLGEFGKSHYHADIQPAAYRVHPGGVWSMADQRSRMDDGLNTRFWMYRYYKRVGKQELADHFQAAYQRRVLRDISAKEMIQESFRRLINGSGLRALVKRLIGQQCVSRLREVAKKFTTRNS